MATYEEKGQLTYKDEQGNLHLLHPKTKMDCVDGLEDAQGGKAPKSHTEDKNNPHGVTASQVGARPNNWMPTASDVGARPNTWMPTALDVGAAIGAKILTSGADLNEIWDSGMYRLVGTHTNMPSGAAHGQLLVIHGGADTIAQIVFKFSSAEMWVRTGSGSKSNCTFTEWRQVYTTGFKPTAADVGAVAKSGDTMTGMLYVPDLSVFGDGYKAVSFLSADKKGRAEVQVASSNRFVLNQRVTGSAYADRYLLPTLNTGLTGDKWYDILTSKTPVSIAQGGTGANNLTDALSNLGLKQFRTYYFDNCSTPLLTLQNNYNSIDNVACLIYCVCGGTRYALVGYKVDKYCAFVEVGYGTADLYKYRNNNGTWTMHTYKAG